MPEEEVIAEVVCHACGASWAEYVTLSPFLIIQEIKVVCVGCPKTYVIIVINNEPPNEQN